MSNLHFLDPQPTGQPAVLLLHGLGADANSWALQVPALVEAGYRPLAVDTPGFGLSPFDGKGWSIHRVAGEMADLLKELDAAPAHVVGLSMGGTIAQQLALDFPGCVRRLVLVSTFAVLRPDSLGGWVYFLRRAAVISMLGLKPQARVVAQRIFPQVDQAALREMLVDTISRADPRAYRQAMIALGMFNSLKRLGALSVPTLVVSGEQDTTVSPARQTILAHAIQGAQQLILPGAGHAAPVDQPGNFNRELLAFLAKGS
jgi:3-oxoadipate enol-lactonase